MKRRNFLNTLLIGGAGLAASNPLKSLAASPGVNPADSASGAAAPHSTFSILHSTLGGGSADTAPRSRLQIDFDWRFHLGDLKNAHLPSFDDTDTKNWRLLDLPHDWSIEGKIEQSNPASWHGAYLPGGIGWYRKKIAFDPSWQNRNVFIDFDGVYMNSDVWINGHHLGRWPYGYTTFRYDLTPFLRPGDNLIAVRVDNSKQPSGRWYTGCGIYRHVWLNIVNPVHVDQWGTFVTTPSITKQSAQVRILTQLANATAAAASVTVEQIIRDKNARVVARVQTPDAVTLKPNATTELTQELTIPSPALWSPDTPNLYRVETLVRERAREGGAAAPLRVCECPDTENRKLKTENSIADRYSTPLGLRTLEFSPAFGFRLNGERTMLKGVCNHHDAGGALGAAVPDDVLYHRLKQLKEIGCNAVRTAHNPHAPELTAFCDELGLMVLDEAFDGWAKPKGNSQYDYGNYFTDWWQKDLGAMIRRDRNNPSVIIWSIGNEVSGFTDEMQHTLADFTRALDPTRPVTEARGSEGSGLDIYGFNSEAEKKGKFESYHAQYPDRVLLGTEMPHTRQTRGVYFTQSPRADEGPKGERHPVPSLSETEIFTEKRKGYSTSFDMQFFSIGVRDQFKQNLRYPYLIGSFRWTGFDYLGEANDKWPFRSKDKGVFDLAGLAKDHYFLYQSLWTAKPMIHLLPHWTHPGKEGVKIPIVAYTNCHSAELFLNGKSLGAQPMPADLQIVWQVPYQPGELRAIARDKNGVVLAETTRRTAGPAARVDIIPNKTHLRANRQDTSILEVTITDAEGTPLPDAEDQLTFLLEGPCKLIGLDNGDVLDISPTKFVTTRRAFKSKCVAIIQATDQSGETKITITSGALTPATLRLTSAPA